MARPLLSTQETDLALVQRMARGEQEALRELHAVHAPLLLGIVQRILGDNRDTDDVVQDVFLEAWRLASQYEPARGSVAAWLIFRARNRAVDRLRQRQRRPEPREPDELEGGDSSLSFEVTDSVERALGGLSDPQRAVIELSFFSGYTGPEIARRTGFSLANVKNHLRRALARMRSTTATHD